MKLSINAVTMGLGSALLVCVANVHAGQEVSVGRVDVRLPGEDDAWQVYDLKGEGLRFAGSGVDFQQSGEWKVVVHRSANRVIDALLWFRANSSGKGRFSGVQYPGARCEGARGVFAEGSEPGSGARSFKCLQVTVPHNVVAANNVNPLVKDLMAKEGWTWSPSMHAIAARQFSHGGAFVDVVALVAPEFLPAVDQAAEGEAGKDGVSAKSIRWGRLLQEAVTDSVYSIRGNLPVPDLRLPASHEKDPSATTQ